MFPIHAHCLPRLVTLLTGCDEVKTLGGAGAVAKELVHDALKGHGTMLTEGLELGLSLIHI